MTDRRVSLVWLQAAGCGGCTMSLLGAEQPGLTGMLQAFGIDLLWHPSLSEATGAPVVALLEDLCAGRRPLDLLVIEGAVLRGPNGSGRFQMLGGSYAG